MAIKKSGPLPRSKAKGGLMYGLGRLSQSGMIRAERQIREQHRKKRK
jgi:hypothetical protein